MENFERNGPKVDLQNTFIVHEKPQLDQNLLLEFKAHPQHNTTQHNTHKPSRCYNLPRKLKTTKGSLSPLKSTLGRFEAL